jgi:hypothetical protein
MKTTKHARRVRQIRVWAGMVAILLLVSAEFWMVCSFGHACGQVNPQPVMHAPALGDLLAAR